MQPLNTRKTHSSNFKFQKMKKQYRYPMVTRWLLVVTRLIWLQCTISIRFLARFGSCRYTCHSDRWYHLWRHVTQAWWRHRLDYCHKWSCYLLPNLNLTKGFLLKQKLTISEKYVSQTPNDKIGWQNFFRCVILNKKWRVEIHIQIRPDFPSPPPPNFNVDTYNVGQHVAAQNNPPTLKVGGGGLF